MTVLEERIEMAHDGGDELTLDTLFEWLEEMPVPEGYRTEVVGGYVSFPFGDEVDLTGTVVGLVLKTDEFPRD
ncbi:hypothetical protein [Streptomyces sp. NPDC047706]|uniref:hypothetical protein n=1 Tax=Streptomyces sp. NPDC047706 TaxID=3365486 RepID=UPI003710E2BC